VSGLYHSDEDKNLCSDDDDDDDNVSRVFNSSSDGCVDVIILWCFEVGGRIR
jgi:hypothetical protein